jgi:CIC family chloride channel protein
MSIASAERNLESERRLRDLRRSHRIAQLGRAALVGLVAGGAAGAFRYMVTLAERFSHGLAARRGELGLLVYLAVPVATALLGGLAGWITLRFAPETSGSGIPHVKAALLGVRRIRAWRVIVVKLAGGLLSLAAGFSLGREGPTVQVGAASGKLVGQGMRAPRRSLNALVAAGAGAGLAGAFNAPLAGFLFVMEELKREMSPLTFGTAFIGSVCAVLVTRAASGPSPSFLLPAVDLVSFSALLPAAVLGVLGGLAGVLFNHALLKATATRPRLPGPCWAASAGVGAVAGVLLLVSPSITGVGHGLAEDILRGQLQARHLVLLAAALFAGKFLLTVFSYGSGVPGGIFAPMLAMGACLGYGSGILIGRFFPQFGLAPTISATIGMAAFLTGSVRAPLTAVVLIVEMTREYNLLFPLLLGCFLAYAAADLLRSKPIYDALLDRELSSLETGRPDATDVSQFELMVEPDSLWAGRALSALHIPAGARVTMIVRQGRDVIPHGDTRLEAGDLITMVIEERAAEAAARIVDAVRGV